LLLGAESIDFRIVIKRWMASCALVWLAVASARAATYTVTSGANTGGGSLRTAINNANGNPGSTIAFAIPTSDSRYSAATGVFKLNITSTLPAITAAGTILDGTTQTTAIGNTNTRVLGAGGTVGVDGLTLPTVPGPEIQIQDGGGLAVGLDIQASNVTIRGIAILGFGVTANSNNDANIRIGATAAGALIERNVIGATAIAFADPGGAARSGGDNIRAVGGDNGTISNNLIGFSLGKGFCAETNSDGWQVIGNEMRMNGINTYNLDNIDLEYSAGATVRGNLLTQSPACGVENYGGSGRNTIQNNTISGNGTSTLANAEVMGVRLYGAGNTVDRNIITGNVGAGVEVTAGASSTVITRNSIYGNGTIGIDLQSAADNANSGTAPYVTRNDAGDADTGGNGLLNFPALQYAVLGGTTLSVSGWARPGSTVEVFVSDGDASGFGEGRTFVFAAAEGSGADLDATTGSYPDPLNGLSQGTDTTNRFRFNVTVPGGIVLGTRLTATATLASATSEFSGYVIVQSSPSMTLLKSVSPGGARPPGTDLAYSVVFTNTAGTPAIDPVVVDTVPANTDFKVGSVTTNLGTSGLTVVVAYSNDGGTTWAYVPAGGAGGAPAGYDRTVTNVRWTLTGSLTSTAPGNTGSVAFTARVR
jgi:trimeric autotransporter adhesin